MKRSGLNNQPHQRRDYAKRTAPCGKRTTGFMGEVKVCVLDADHKGKCQGPFRRMR